MGKVLKGVVKHLTPGVRDLIPIIGGVATVIAGYFGGPAGVAAVSAVASFGAATSKERGLSFSGSEALGRLLTASDPQAFGSWVFGETALQSNIVYAEQYGSENQFGLQVIAGAAHEIDSFGQMYINDEAVNFSGNNATASWSGAVRRFTRNGTEGQTAITVSGSSWPSTAKFSGVCHYALEWDASHDKVKGGVPRRVTQVVKGAPVYDPRFDSDVGGSGTQRADDQTTWSYQNGSGDAGANWALIVLFYLLGWRLNGRLVIGMGVDKDDIDYASFIEAANVCDALKDGIPQYHLGGILPTNGDHSTTLSQLEQMIGGVITKGFDGVWRVWAPNGNLVPVGTITENDLLAEEAEVHDPGGNLEVLYNTGRASFVNPATLYQPDDAPDVVDPGALSDDGRERLLQVDLTAVQHEARAQRIIHHLIRRSRFQRTWTVGVGPKGILYNYFDVLTLNTQTTNYEDQLVRVVGVQASASGIVILTLREEDPLIYQLDLPLGTLGQRNIPPTFDPSTKIAVTGMTLEATSVSGQSGTVRPAISVSFNDPGPLVDKTQIEYRKQGDSNWTTGAANFVDNISAVIQPLHPSTTYEVRVNHVSVSGVAGGWSQLSAETGPLESTLWSGVTGPGRPEDGADVTRFGLFVVDNEGKPAGVQPTESINNRSQIEFGGLGVRILGAPDAEAAYGFPAIPIDDTATYTVIVRHKSSAASSQGLFVRFEEYNAPLPAGKTHVVGTLVTLPYAQPRTSQQTLVGNGAMPGTSLVESIYSYTPSAGTKFATLSFYNWSAFSGYYEIESIRVTRQGSSVNLLSQFVSSLDRPASMALNKGAETDDLTKWFGNFQNTSPLHSVYSISDVSLIDGVGDKAIRGEDNLDQSNDLFSEPIAIDPTKHYKVSVYARQPFGNRQNYLLVNFLRGDLTPIFRNTDSNATGWASGTFHYFAVVNSVFAANFQKYEFIFGPNGQGTIPNAAGHTAAYAQIGVLGMRNGTTNTRIELQGYRLEEIADALTLVNGPAQAGADVTGSNTSNNTANVGTSTAADVADGSSRALAVIRADMASVEDISLYQNGTTRTLTRGYSEGPVRDGDAVSFAQSWDSASFPVIVFFGGRTDSGTLANETNTRYRALNQSASGFTADLKIVESIGSPTTYQDPEASGGTNMVREADKIRSVQAVDDTYHFHFDILINNGPQIEGLPVRSPGRMTLGFYTNDGSGFVQRATKTFNGSSSLSETETVLLNQVVDVVVDGLGQVAGREFRIVVEDQGEYGADLTNLHYVEYTTAAPAGFVTATPVGSPDMRFEVKGGVE